MASERVATARPLPASRAGQAAGAEFASVAVSPFGPVARRTVADEIRERIAESIRSGELRAGDRLPPERQLCEQFHVARTTVREAIQGLISLRYLERRGNRPYVVGSRRSSVLGLESSGTNVLELFETRRVLEAQVAELVCDRATAEQRAHLAALASQFAELTDASDVAEFRRLDRAFHADLAGSCGNGLLTELHREVLHSLLESEVYAWLLFGRPESTDVSSFMAASARRHAALAAALLEGDRTTVASEAAGHLTDIADRLPDGGRR
jgi:GntR family transcriptional repressor for pyruvate dehydrogenase complex